ncbi:hypothetical protein BH23ACT10_BH23ACT10_25730 [soil metagenome]
MESASPEPFRSGGPRPSIGTAAQDQAATGTPADAEAVSRVIDVIDDQADPVDLARVRRLVVHVLAALDVPVELEVSVTCVDRHRIAELNEAYLGGEGPTDVLAFPIDAVDDVDAGVPGLLGDVVVCPRVAATQAGTHGRTVTAELDLLVVHGILHLLGHDHADDDERTRMFGLTDRLLAAFVPDGGRRP